jgi:hypothetical protein
LVNGDHGYCLLYPADFEVEHPIDYETVLIGPVPQAGDRAIAFVEVTDAGGQTTSEAADAVVAERTGGMTGFDIERQEITVDGELAVLLDGLPGQDSTRMIVVVYDGRLYRLSFMPSNPNLPEAYADMERLYTLLLDTFRFIR